MLRRRFDRFVTREDSDRYHRLFVSLMQHDERQACELALQRGDGSTFHAQLDCVRVAAGDEPPAARITLTDVTERKRAEAELRIAAAAFESQEGMFVADAEERDPADQPGLLRHHRLHGRGSRGADDAPASSRTATTRPSPRRCGRDVNRTGAWRGEIWNRQKNGAVSPRWLTVTAVRGATEALPTTSAPSSTSPSARRTRQRSRIWPSTIR